MGRIAAGALEVTNFKATIVPTEGGYTHARTFASVSKHCSAYCMKPCIDPVGLVRHLYQRSFAGAVDDLESQGKTTLVCSVASLARLKVEAKNHYICIFSYF